MHRIVTQRLHNSPFHPTFPSISITSFLHHRSPTTCHPPGEQVPHDADTAVRGQARKRREEEPGRQRRIIATVYRHQPGEGKEEGKDCRAQRKVPGEGNIRMRPGRRSNIKNLILIPFHQIQQGPYLRFKFREFVLDNIPDNLIIDRKIPMDYLVADPCHELPGNARVLFPDFYRDILGSFTDDLQGSGYRMFRCLILQKIIVGDS